MVYKHYNISLSVRLFFIVVVSVAMGFVYDGNFSFTLVTLVFLDTLLIYHLIVFLNRTNRQISFFIQAVKNEDTTLHFPAKTGNAIISDLHKNLNELNIILQDTKVRNQIKERYFSEILHSIPTGIMVINEKGFITESNPVVLELLGLQTLTHISQIDRVDSRFKNELNKVRNRQKQVLSLRQKDDVVQIIVRCSVINLKNEEVRILTLQDIRGELERKEIDSWVKLIRVLSHEIMNSLAPVTSIAQSLHHIWQKRTHKDAVMALDDDVKSTLGGLDVIAERGEALKHFVQSYRVLTQAPVLNMQQLTMQSFFDRLSILLSPIKENFNGTILFTPLHVNFELQMDEQMMVQVVINLVKNAVEAIDKQQNGRVTIAAEQVYEITEIEITNNGPEISPNVLEEIFIPFFTTKQTGSGIGLSYSRQILRAHGGSLSCSSNSIKTVFKMRW